MRVFLRSTLILMVSSSAPAFAANYSPVSDKVISRLQVAPESAAEVAEMCNSRIESIKSLQAEVEALPLTHPSAKLIAAYDDLYHLAGTSLYMEPQLIKETNSDPLIRKAAEECIQRTNRIALGVLMSRPIYERLRAAERQGVAPDLSYMLTRQIDRYRRMGVDRDAATRKRVAELLQETRLIGMEFDRNISSDSSAVKAKPEDLAGLPPDYLESHNPGPDGLVTIKMTNAEASPILRYAKSADLRKRVLLAWLNRAHPANEAVLKRLFAARAELANLLGYKSYAEYDIANRMAQSPARVQRFIDEIAAAARPIAEKEASLLVERLQKDVPTVNRLESADAAYAANLIRSEVYDVDPKVVREYFAFSKVRDGIFQLTRDLFGVDIRPWTTEVWSPEVGAYEIVEDGDVIGRFFLDMHPRDNKYTHAAMYPLRIGIKDRTVPVAALLTNFPTGLMEHGQVETFLHEFGHLLHWIFAGQRPYAAQNFSEIENDVTETPSTLLEEWVWDYDTLAKFAANSEGQAIPRDLVDKMVAARNFGRALATMDQLGASAVALDYYSSDVSEADLTERFNTVTARYSLAVRPDGHHFPSSWGHLDGYGASYYTYQWSRALAADLLSRFRSAGLRDQVTAKAYREMILAPGGSASMNVLARDFLGRDWSIEAYRKELESGVEIAAATAAH